MHYLLYYAKVTDHATREPPFRDAHIQHVRDAVERGDVLLAGSLVEPEDGVAVLLFESESPAKAEAFAATDPYVVEGIISRWHVRKWDTVFAAPTLVAKSGTR